MKAVRTIEEMRFAASIESCSSCGARHFAERDLRGQGVQWTLSGVCARCGAKPVLSFTSLGNPTHTRVGRFDLGPLRSQQLTSEEFLAAYEEASGRVPTDPGTLTPALREVADEQLTRALICVTELMKLLPLGTSRMPGTTDPRLERSWLSAEYKRLRVLVGTYARPSSIDDAELASHRAWLDRGATGSGQLVLAGRTMVREVYGAVDLTFVEIAHGDLTAINLAEARLERALIEDTALHLANVRAASFRSAVLRRGNWSCINAAGATFDDAEIDGLDLSRSELDASRWYDARVQSSCFDGARFGDAALDRATFQKCSFADATFALFTGDPEPTTSGASFVDCDLTATDWTGRNLTGVTFIRCRLEGATGKPSATEGLVVRDCDVSEPAFLAPD